MQSATVAQAGAPERKRVADAASAERHTQLARHERTVYQLEYQPNIGRVSVCVQGATGSSAPSCHVSAYDNGAVVHLEVKGAWEDQVPVPWALAEGHFDASPTPDGFMVTLPAQGASVANTAPVDTPWTGILAAGPLRALHCGTCDAQVAQLDASNVCVRALPSENWEELVDAWMCHGDQRLNTSVTQGRQGVQASRVPEKDEVWLGRIVLKISSEHVDRRSVQSADTPISGAWEVRSTVCGPVTARNGPAESQHRASHRGPSGDGSNDLDTKGRADAVGQCHAHFG